MEIVRGSDEAPRESIEPIIPQPFWMSCTCYVSLVMLVERLSPPAGRSTAAAVYTYIPEHKLRGERELCCAK